MLAARTSSHSVTLSCGGKAYGRRAREACSASFHFTSYRKHLWGFVVVVFSHSIMSLWTIAHPAPLSMGFPRQKYWSGLSFPSPGDFPNLWIKPTSPALAGGFFITEPSEKPVYLAKLYQIDTLKIAWAIESFYNGSNPFHQRRFKPIRYYSVGKLALLMVDINKNIWRISWKYWGGLYLSEFFQL